MPGSPSLRRSRASALATLALLGAIGAAPAVADTLAWTDLDGAQVLWETVPVRLSAAALLVSGQTAGTIPVGLALARREGFEVDVQIEVGIDPGSRDLEVFLYAFSPDHETLSTRSHRVRLGEDESADGLKIVSRLAAYEPVGYVRVLVHPVDLDEFGLAAARVPSGDPSSAGTEFWLLEPGSGWSVAVAGELAAVTPSPLAPGRQDGSQLVPAASPVLRGGEDRLLRLPPGTPAGEKTLHFEPLVGGEAHTVELHSSGGGRYRFEVPALDQGRYAVWWSDPADTAVPEGDLPTVFVLEADAEVRSWIELAGSEAREPEGWQSRLTSALTAEEREALTRRREFMAAYRSILEQLAAGERDAAQTALMDFEVGVGSQGADGFVTLTRLQWQSLRALLDDDFQNAMPIAILHANQAVGYLDRQHHQLTDHSLKMAARIMMRRSRVSETGEEGRQAADLLLDLAGLVRGRPLLRDRLYLSAIEAAPEHARVWLSRAANYERQGFYQEAIDDLEHALELDPALGEARLRLGVCLSRRQRTRNDGLVHFGELAADGSVPDWVGAIAAQELARHHLLQGRLDESVKAAQSGLRRWPEDQQLRIVSARALREAGEYESAAEMLKQADRPLTGIGPSARTRYNMLPREDFVAGIASLEEEASSWLAPLREQLGGSGE